MRTHHPDAREGYDLWSETYDTTANPVVVLDDRYTPAALRPEAGENVLDAGCGTGRYFSELDAAQCRTVGVDFSPGMLLVARRKFPQTPLVLADLEQPLPFRDSSFDAAVCALVGEHIGDLPFAFSELQRVLREGGRLVFSVYHPAMAAAGKEANFERDGTEYRLGAIRHSLTDYAHALRLSGFVRISVQEFNGDEQLVVRVPSARKYLGFPMLVVYHARKLAGWREPPSAAQ